MLYPTRGKIIVKIIPDTKQLPSGLYIAETVKDIPHRGEIISIGSPFIDDKGKEHKWEFEIGEIAHFKRQWGKQIETVILRRDDIIAVESVIGTVKAIGDNVIIKRHVLNKIGNSTIVIPEGMGIKENLMEYYGEVISVGPSNRMDISVGDKLHYHRNEGLLVKINNEEFWSLKVRAILAKIS